MSEPQTLMVNDVKYVREDSGAQERAEAFNGCEYVICRTYSAGVFAGYLQTKNGKEVVMRDARRLWYWCGAASLSQLAVDGVSKPEQCKFPVAVDEVTLTEAIEIIPCTKKAETSIKGVPVWKR